MVYGIRCIGTYSSAKFEYIKIYNIYESIEKYIKINKIYKTKSRETDENFVSKVMEGVNWNEK